MSYGFSVAVFQRDRVTVYRNGSIETGVIDRIIAATPVNCQVLEGIAEIESVISGPAFDGFDVFQRVGFPCADIRRCVIRVGKVYDQIFRASE